MGRINGRLEGRNKARVAGLKRIVEILRTRKPLKPPRIRVVDPEKVPARRHRRQDRIRWPRAGEMGGDETCPGMRAPNAPLIVAKALVEAVLCNRKKPPP